MTHSKLGNGSEEPLERASYLIEGRRVLVSDLVDAGLLAAGTQLTFRRKQAGEAHLAKVTGDGRIELSDGQQFKSPSAAAAAATGRGPFDGWTAWALDDGTLLDVLRQTLLDTVAEQPASAGSTADVSAARHSRLKDARRQADAGSPITLTVRDLLGWWGASRRGYLISEQIASELTNHGLSTVPDFAAVGIDDRVTLTGPSVDSADAETAEPKATMGQAEPRTTGAPTPATTSGDEEEDKGEPIQGQTVGNLPSALRGVVSVTSSASFEEAFTKMQLNGYSQLPVLNGTRNLQGAVTWESIAQARYQDSQAPFSQAIVKAHDVSYADHLIDVLPYLEQHGFLLVRDQTKQIAGIITIADVAAEYGATARPFLLIGDLDRQLRRVISEGLDLQEVITPCDPDKLRNITSFSQMSYGDYQQVLSNQQQWDRLGWPLDRKAFVTRLDELREVRNELMHFNDKDKAGDDAIPKLRNMIELLRRYGS
ncbi:CBS domain-containing protein [Streptomyces microflavus]|uniref:restriction system modified-DNA reader domain-containing protein n=1 Tax=Streptomyces microflavus TaxID=1919 RepID=UPI00380337E7